MPLGTPYVTPAMLINAPTGAAWEQIPFATATTEANTAELTNICWRATSTVDTDCGQVLRATVDTEEMSGPGAPRVSVQRDTGNGLLVMRRWPVTDVLAVQISSNRSWPRQWTPVPADQYEVDRPLINSALDTASATTPDGGSSILVAPGYLGWRYGRNGQRVQVSYTNGWPHTSLTVDAMAGDSILHVDDVTGWAGANGFVYDGASTEALSVVSVDAALPLVLPNGAGVAQTGPGTVTLSSPLTYGHAASVIVSALPATVLWATVLACVMQVLESGTTSITIPDLPGAQVKGGQGIIDLRTEYERRLMPFARVA